MTMSEYLSKYPWLRGYDPYPETTDEEQYCALEDMPSGWREAFGDLFCEDLDRVIKSEGLENEFRIDQLKEKWGAMRIYCGPCTPAIQDVIRTYETYSESVCIGCGNVEGVKMVTWGWTEPLCRCCIGKIHRVPNFSKFDALPDQELPDVLKWTRYSTDGTQHFEMDISETTRKIRERYAERKANGEFEEDLFEEWEDNYYGA